MTSLRTIILMLSVAVLAVPPASAVSIRSLLGLDDEESETQESAAETPAREAQVATKPGANNWGQFAASGTELNLDFVKRILVNLQPNQRQALLADEAAFKRFARQEASNLSVAAAARSNNLDTDLNTAFLMQRGAENIMREIYINKLIAEKLPADFPSEEQIREYYEKNQDNFVINERVHVWQIFFPVSEDMDDNAVAALKKKANDIADSIRKKKTSFNDAAVKHSKHAQSSVNGGYMGLIKSSDLKPDIKKTILSMAEGKISQVLTTDTGIHIVRRGAIVPERKISLEESKTQIRQLMIKQVQGQLRNAIFEQAAKTYPVEINDNKIEEWRLRLRTNTEASTGN